jgi:hypothetical protein
MGCSRSVQPLAPTIINKPDRIINSRSLIEACRSGDIKHVAVLLRTITLIEINKADWTTGNTPLHLATCYDHIDIVRLLLRFGAMRNILNYEKKIPAHYASTIEMRQLFERVTNNRFVNNDSNEEDNKEIEWLQSSIDATQFYMEYESGMSYSGQWDIDKTIDALRKASELGNMYDLNVVWNFFEQARDKTDAKYLIRAYTIESKFCKILNEKLIERRLKKSMPRNENEQMQTLMQNTMTMFNQGFALAQALMTARLQTDNSDITDWVHRYMGTIHSLIYQPIFPFTGLTYRGMWIKKEAIIHYSENHLYMCNKTLTSTSKNYQIVKRSMDECTPLAGQIPVMCTYFIDSYTSFKAIDIHSISEYPDEEEVILFPGIPFEIRKIDMNTIMNMLEIELVPMLSNFENLQKMFSDILN